MGLLILTQVFTVSAIGAILVFQFFFLQIISAFIAVYWMLSFFSYFFIEQ